MSKYKIKVGITIGDPSGIGPAITLKAVNRLKNLAHFVIIADKWVLSRLSPIAYRLFNVRFIDLKNIPHKNFRFGLIRAEYGKASIEYLDKALELFENKEINCLVTCPISKEAINLCGFKYAGHTEYLAKCTHSKNIVMMLLNDKLKFSLVTRHIPLKDVALYLSNDILYKNISLAHTCLKKLFLIKEPRIVVCGLNPHASDKGLLGNEENRFIKPAIEKIKAELKAHIDGPLSADVAIHKAMKKEYDCVIAMYHDQAMIPLKLSGFDTGVNLTLGLPFVRTSPLHGTAFDIAKNPKLANPNSLIQAIRLAIKCTSNLKRD
jgi:4-hydroxythreonine-4-phosphate dehydrogenase